MPDNEFRNMNAMFGYDEWNDEYEKLEKRLHEEYKIQG